MTTVLIIDDSPSFRAQARILLTAEGFDVVGEAEDGVAALAACRDLRPEIVILDVGLPDIDGFELADELAGGRSGPGKRPTVVLTSSREASAYRRRLQRSAATGFVAKDELSASAIAAVIAAREA